MALFDWKEMSITKAVRRRHNADAKEVTSSKGTDLRNLVAHTYLSPFGRSYKSSLGEHLKIAVIRSISSMFSVFSEPHAKIELPYRLRSGRHPRPDSLRKDERSGS